MHYFNLKSYTPWNRLYSACHFNRPLYLYKQVYTVYLWLCNGSKNIEFPEYNYEQLNENHRNYRFIHVWAFIVTLEPLTWQKRWPQSAAQSWGSLWGEQLLNLHKPKCETAKKRKKHRKEFVTTKKVINELCILLLARWLWATVLSSLSLVLERLKNYLPLSSACLETLLALIVSTDACEYLSALVSTWQSSAPSGVVGQLCLGGILIS